MPATTYTVKGLKADMVYEFRVAAENRAGVGPSSESSSPVKAEERIGKSQKPHAFCVDQSVRKHFLLISFSQN